MRAADRRQRSVSTRADGLMALVTARDEAEGASLADRY